MAPLGEFLDRTAAGGMFLLAAALVALAWSNSPFAASYFELWALPLSIGLGDASLTMSVQHWINDGLMAIFFLVVGLEIKRELLVGELASLRRALLPATAAIGGALLPALIFVAIVGGGPGATGWGVPMATDIAFALGVLAVLGPRVPLGLRIFVAALAIVDDLLAVVVIGLFYTGAISMPALAGAAVVMALLIGANRLGIRRPLVYGGLGIVLWLAIYQSGIHATVAGVLLAATIPARERIPDIHFANRARKLIDDFVHSRGNGIHHRHAALWELETITEHAQPPMLRLEHTLTPWVAFAIVPLFALANAGITISGDLGNMLVDPVVIGIVAGLVIGKQVGITAAAWVIVRAGWATLPSGVSWRHIYGAAWVCGIGFTMSLFIADLAFEETRVLDLAKLGILVASLSAAAGGYILLRLVAGRTR